MSTPLTFLEYRHRWPDAHPALLNVAFGSLPQRDQDACWDDLKHRAWLRIESELEVERQDEEEWPPPKRQQRPQPSTQHTSTNPWRVGVSTKGADPLKSVDLRTYLAAKGVVVPPRGKARCIAPDHEDRHPSMTVTADHFRCWSCGAHGDVIEAASLLHGIDATGRDYWRVRDLIVRDLLLEPLCHEEGQ